MSDFTNDLISSTLSKVNGDHYTLYPDGSRVHQTSAPQVIEQLLRMLAPQSGDHILEIGTGSGYSTALLATIVGDAGTITSIDIDNNMVQRASLLLRQNGYTNVHVHLGDGRMGYPDGAPYHRMIAWASVEDEAPAPLVDQLMTGGMIVCPFQGENTSWISALIKHEGGGLQEVERMPGGFIPMTSAPWYPWLDKGKD